MFLVNNNHCLVYVVTECENEGTTRCVIRSTHKTLLTRKLVSLVSNSKETNETVSLSRFMSVIYYFLKKTHTFIVLSYTV